MLPEVPPVTDEADFAAWVAARGDALQRFAFLVTGNAAEAPDLVQDALSHAYPRWRSLATSGTAEAYVRKSIVNGSVSRWRKRRRLTVVEDVEPFAEPLDDPAATYGEADEAWELCRSLPTKQRAAVVLRYYEDLSFAQIALILGCTETTARSHVHRALTTLRSRLKGEDDA